MSRPVSACCTSLKVSPRLITSATQVGAEPLAFLGLFGELSTSLFERLACGGSLLFRLGYRLAQSLHSVVFGGSRLRRLRELVLESRGALAGRLELLLEGTCVLAQPFG